MKTDIFLGDEETDTVRVIAVIYEKRDQAAHTKISVKNYGE